jgi:hypothetical protein
MNLPDNSILDTLISLTLIYALLSVLVSILIEWWNHRQKSRAQMLHQSILQLLKDPLNLDYGYLFYSHYTITGLKSTENRPPQYISSSTFADVLIDIISQQAKKMQPIQQSIVDDLKIFTATVNTNSPTTVMQGFVLGLDTMKNSPFKELLLSLVDKSGENYDNLKSLLENWYNDYMDRVTGWYKTAQQSKFVFFGFVVAIALNVDSLHLLKIISLDPQFRKTLVAQAENVVNQYETDTLKSILTDEKIRFYLNNDTTTAKKGKERLTKIVSMLDSVTKTNYLKIDSTMWTIEQLNIPVGWSQNTAPLSWRWGSCKDSTANESKPTSSLAAYNEERNHPQDCWTIVKYFLGICLSGISLSFGAPFWFDLLVKFVNIRRAGKKPETTTNPKA